MSIIQSKNIGFGTFGIYNSKNIGYGGMGIYSPEIRGGDPITDFLKYADFMILPDKADGTSTGINDPLTNPCQDLVESGRYLPLTINIANNGEDYANWTVTGTGTTKGANGIHLVDSTNKETAKLTISGLESSKTYKVKYSVLEKVGNPVLRQSNNLTGTDFTIFAPSLGQGEYIFTTRSNLTVKQLWFYLVGGTSITFTIDSVSEVANYARTTTPKLVLTFDDGWASQYTRAFNYMKTKNVKGTLYMIGNATGTTNFVTKPMLDEMHANGWCIANHTLDHDYMGSSTYAEAKEIIEEGMNWLSANGYIRGVNHLAYPGGQYNADVLQAYFDLGGLTARTITIGNGSNDTIIPNLFEVNTQTLGGGATTLAQAKTLITNAITNGSTELFMFHRIVDTLAEVGSDGMNILTSDFNELIDYAVASGIEIMTIDEWYQSLQIENPYWTGANVLWQNMAGTVDDGYVQETVNVKSRTFVKLDGVDTYGSLATENAPNPVGLQDFAFGYVFKTNTSPTGHFLYRGDDTGYTRQYATYIQTGGIGLNLGNVSFAAGTVGASIIEDTFYKVFWGRKNGVIFLKLNGAETFSEPNTTNISSTDYVSFGARNSTDSTYTYFNNNNIGLSAYNDGDNIDKFEETFNKVTNYLYGL